MKKPVTWYVYTYAFPDSTVFYVGKGKNSGINDHEDEASSDCDCKKCATIREIWASGSPVKKQIVFETFVELEALAKEWELIQAHSSSILTNIRGLPVEALEPTHTGPFPRIVTYMRLQTIADVVDFAEI